jgi:hypothetical protein
MNLTGVTNTSNLVKDKNGDLLVDSHNILNRWKNYSQLLNVHRVNDLRQIEMHRADRLVHDPSPFEVEIAIVKLKRYKLPFNDEILTELIQAEGETVQSEIHKLISPVWCKDGLPDQWKEVIILSG